MVDARPFCEVVQVHLYDFEGNFDRAFAIYVPAARTPPTEVSLVNREGMHVLLQLMPDWEGYAYAQHAVPYRLVRRLERAESEVGHGTQ